MVLFYGVLGGSCDTAGGADAPFHFLSGKPVRHGNTAVAATGRACGITPKTDTSADLCHPSYSGGFALRSSCGASHSE